MRYLLVLFTRLLKPKNFDYFETKFNTMNRLILFTVVSFLSFSIIGCNKNDNPPPTNTDYIIKGSWKFDKAMSGGADVSGFLNTCYKDNTTTFQANGNGSLDEGATKCNAADPQTTNFTWNFTNDGSTLNVTAGIFAGQSGSFTVITLNDTQMVLQGTISTPAGPVTGQIYFKH